MMPPLYGRLIARWRHGRWCHLYGKGTCFNSTRGHTGYILVYIKAVAELTLPAYLLHDSVVRVSELLATVLGPVGPSHQLLHHLPDVKQRVVVARRDVLQSESETSCVK